MFGSEFSTMDDDALMLSTSAAEETSAALSMDYAFHKMNFSPSDSGMQVSYLFSRKLEIFITAVQKTSHLQAYNPAVKNLVTQTELKLGSG